MNTLEFKLSKYFKRKYCILTGNGTTAMYLYFQLLKKKSVILFPSITCVQAVSAALFCGHKILSTDTSIEDYTMNYRNFLKVAQNNKIDVVVPTHTFGHVIDLDKIIKYCNQKNILILEDATQSMGGYINNNRTGSFGDASVISFGYSKILDCGNGGCLLTNNHTIYSNIKKSIKLIPKKSKDYSKKINNYKKKYYLLKDKTKSNKIFWKKIFDLQKPLKKYLIYKMDKKTEIKINKKFLKLSNIIKIRNRNQSIYDKYLNIKKIITPSLSPGSISWRYTFLIRKSRDKFISFLRKKNIDVSSWYPSLHYTSLQKNKDFKNSILIEKQIVNLWTDETKKKESIIKDINIINSYLDK